VRVGAVDRVADAQHWPSRRFALGDDIGTEFIIR